MTRSNATLARRIGAAALAAACGLLVGAAVAAALGTVQVLLRPGLEMASTPRALILGPLTTLAEGLFWGLLGGAMYVFPPAVLVFACCQPRNTRTAALAISALLLLPVVLAGFRNRWIDALLLAVSVWLGVRVGLRTFSRTIWTPKTPEGSEA